MAEPGALSLGVAEVRSRPDPRPGPGSAPQELPAPAGSRWPSRDAPPATSPPASRPRTSSRPTGEHPAVRVRTAGLRRSGPGSSTTTRTETPSRGPSGVVMAAQGTAGRAEDLEGSNHADAVVGVDAGGGFRVDPPQGDAAGGHRIGSPGPRAGVERLVARGPSKRPCSRHEGRGRCPTTRKPPSRRDVADGRPRTAPVFRGRKVLGRISNVDEVVRHEPLLLRRRLGAADIEAAIHLEAVAGDDLAIVGEGQLQAEAALARRGRAHDRDQGSRQ